MIRTSGGLLFNLLIAFTLTALAPFSARAEVTRAQLETTWVGTGQSTATAEDFERLLAVTRSDPETNQLVTDIATRMRTTPEGLLQMVRLCSDMGANRGGEFHHSATWYRRSLRPTGTGAASWGDDAEAARAASLTERLRRGDVAQYLELTTMPSICMKPGMPLLQTFLTFVHELTHFRGYRDLSELDEDVLSYADADDYAMKKVTGPGGELESYIAEGRAMKRLRARGLNVPVTHLERFFDAAGNNTDRQGLIQYILDTLGYRSNLGSTYLRLATSQHVRARSNAAWMHDLLRPEITKKYEILRDSAGEWRASANTTGAPNAVAQAERYEEKRDWYASYLSRISAEVHRELDRARAIQVRFPHLFNE